MSLLSPSDRERLRAELAAMPGAVRLLFFTQSLGCDTCPQTRRILDEVVSLGDRVALEEYNVVLDREKAAEYGIDRAPAIAVVGERDSGIRFYGVPAGYEFMSLVEAILLVSRGEADLSDESRAMVAALDRPLALQVFVTPT